MKVFLWTFSSLELKNLDRKIKVHQNSLFDKKSCYNTSFSKKHR